MLEKVKELFYKWSYNTTALWEDERYIRSILTCLLSPVLVGGTFGTIVHKRKEGGHFSTVS